MPFRLFKKKFTVVTHSGSFHADDVFACATLKIWAEKNNFDLKIVRSRDQKVIDRADIVVDVGNIYNASNKRFDHHQRGGAGTHGNGIPYASFGLIWKHYAEHICNKEVAEIIDRRLVTPIDARDNGIAISQANELGIMDHRTGDAISDFTPTWKEPRDTAMRQFEKAMDFAGEIIGREIAKAEAEVEGARLTRKAIEEQNNPEILVLDKYIEFEQEASKHRNVKLVVSPGRENWAIKTVRENLEDYTSDRIRLPESWWGLRDEELEKISGVKGAIFCIRMGWMAKAKTKEAALEMARKVLA